MQRYTEFSLINHIKELFSDLQRADITTIGDDCAVLPYDESQKLVVTSDMLVEKVHFLRDKISPYQLGRKAVNVNLSDIAAMGAKPLGITLSIALPDATQDTYIEEFVRGVRSTNTLLLGGDTTASKSDFIISITAIGLVENDHLKLRSAAQIGDVIYVTSPLGDSSAGLHSILHNIQDTTLIDAHNNPQAHLSQGLSLGKNPLVHAMMDISDGIASDLTHILNASKLSALVDTTKIPLSDTLIQFCNTHHLNALNFALEGGEDYSLLFTAHRDARFDFPVFEIGEITSSQPPAIKWLPDGNYQGFRHF